VPMPIPSRLPSDGAFDSQTIRLLSSAFEAAWLLVAKGDDIGADADAIRDQLAKHIIDAAQAGERHGGRLRDQAVLFVQRQRKQGVRDAVR